MRSTYSRAAALIAVIGLLLIPTGSQRAEAATAQLATDLDDHAWHFNSMPFADIHDAGIDGSGVVVAIIDDAIDTTHPDLAGKVTSSWRVFPDRLRSPVPMPLAGDRYHGTHVGGIVAALDNGSGITGVAPGATLLSYDVFHEAFMNWDITQTSEALAVAITHAGSRADVINMSLGGISEFFSDSDRQIVCDAVAAATAAGAVVVVAAGNDGEDPFFANYESIPAGCDQALAVASLDSDLDASKFTSFGEHLTVSAPGADILAPVPAATLSDYFGLEEDHSVISLSGTSMASPVVAGIAALIIEANPLLTPSQVRDLITSTALDLGATGPDSLYGAGVIDPAAALGLGLPSPAPALHPTVLAAGPDAFDPGELRVAWRPADGGPAVTGVDVVIWTEAGAITESLPGNRVSLVRDLPESGGFVHVVAHTTSGSYASPIAPFSTDGGFEPTPFDFSADAFTWSADGEVQMEWTSGEPIPEGASLWVYLSAYPGFTGLEWVELALSPQLPAGARSGTVTLDLGAEMMLAFGTDGFLFDRSQREAVDRLVAGLDWSAYYYFIADSTDFDGIAEGGADFDALHPLATLGVASGQRSAEVTVALPDSRKSGLCDSEPCAGDLVEITTPDGTTTGRLTRFMDSTMQIPRPWGETTIPATVSVENLVEDFDALIPVIESAAIGDTGEAIVSDVPGDHPFASEIGWLYTRGLTTGCGEDAFCPSDPVTRGQMAAFLRRAFTAQGDQGVAPSFRDVDGSVYAADIEWAAAAGLTSGCGADRFCPDDVVTRGQMAAFLRRLLGNDITPAGQPMTFTDTAGSVFGDDIAWLSSTGITSGCGADRFCPDDVVTRGQMAAFLRRAYAALDSAF